MMFKDRRDVAVMAPTQDAVRRLDETMEMLARFRLDPLAAVDGLIADHPDFALAHCLRASLFMLGTEKAGLAELARGLAAAKAAPTGERERAHIAALEAWSRGDFDAMVDGYAEATIRFPRDLLALFAGHQGAFLTGQARLLRDHPARALAAWGDAPGRGFVLGMHAFGLEEMGDYARAEDQGRRALELDRGDAWAVHAVTHVMEMQGRAGDGIEFLAAREADWASDNFLACHNWWHRALFLLDREDHAGVLEIYDRGVRPRPSTIAMEMLDASALLWRLRLRGADVGPRWAALADSWTTMLDDAHYPFNAVHAVMAMIGAARMDDARRIVDRVAFRAQGADSGAAMAREVGLPVARALVAFTEGRDGDAIADLAPAIPRAHRYGGSHAQRDLLDLTLLAAAERADPPRARALIAERTDIKPTSLFNWTAAQRVAARAGEGDAAARAARRARMLREAITDSAPSVSRQR